MAFVNLPPNFQDMFNALSDRISKLETGPNEPLYYAISAQTVADSAQGSATGAQSTATNAQLQATQALLQSNNAASQATIAQAQATIASSQATNAQSSANGKNTVYYTGPGAPAPGYAAINGNYFINYPVNNEISLTGYNGFKIGDVVTLSGMTPSLLNGITGTVTYQSYTGFRIAKAGLVSSSGTATGTATNSNTTSFNVGDIWFQYNSSGQVIAQYTYSGAGWGSAPITNAVITNLDAGKITTGILNAIEINAGSGGTAFHVSPTGFMSAQGVYIQGNITADTGTFNGAVKATSGYFGSPSNGFLIGSTGISGYGAGTINGGIITGTTIQSTNMYSGSINSSTITTNAGSIAGWTLSSTGLTNPSANTVISSSDADAVAFSTTRQGIFKYMQINGASGTTLGSSTLAVGGILTVDSDATLVGNIRSVGTTNTTTGSTANAYINPTSGLFARSTSSMRYKKEIEHQEIDPFSVLQLKPKSYFDKTEYEANNNSGEGLPRLLGVIAEEVAQIPVLKDLLVTYNQDGEPDAVNYDRIAVAMIPLLKNLNDRLEALEKK